MRVALLTHASSWGGTEVHTVYLAETLAGRGHETTIVQLGHREYEQAAACGARFAVQHLPLSRAFEQVGFLEWRRRMAAVPADVAILVKGWFLGTSLSLEVAARLTFPGYVVLEHHPADPPPPRPVAGSLASRLRRPGLWWYAQSVGTRIRRRLPDAVIAVSDAVRERLIHDHGYAAARITRVHNGVDTTDFKPDAAAREASRTAWGAQEDCLVFGAVGRLHAIKRFDLAIAAFGRLIEGNRDDRVRLVLAGTGPDRDQLEAHVRTRGLERHVLFTGWVRHARDVLCGLDVFLMPSQQEGLGIALLEAMACGCCPVATGVGGVPEILSGPGLGWLVPPDDAEAFFRAMKAALDLPPDQRLAMAARARAHVVQNFNAAVQYTRIAELLELQHPSRRRELARQQQR